MHMLEPVMYLGILTKVNLFESTTSWEYTPVTHQFTMSSNT